MCGVAGWVRHADGGPQPDAAAVAAAMRHRGPDEGGYRRVGSAELIFRRLALLDIEGGHQPAGDERGRFWSVFNGEVYNFGQLRRDLCDRGHDITAHGDAALIPHLYEEWGASFVQRLRGMFAIAIYDRDRDELFLARDRFGIKPLFVLRTPTHVFFASEARTLMAAAGHRDMDPQSLWHYLTFGYVPDPATPWCGVVKVPPGHHVVVRRGQLTTTRWWQPTMQPTSVTDGHSAERVDAALQDSVTAHLAADVPVGAYLSSGVDSSLLAALAAQRVPLQTFSIGFEGAEGQLDELAAARDLAARLGTEHHEEVITEHDYLTELPGIITSQEGPLADPSAPALWFLARAAARSVKAVLSGEGADELFAGYPIFRQARTLRAFGVLPPRARTGAHSLAARLPTGIKGAGFLQRGTAPLEQRFVGNAPLFDERDKQALMPDARATESRDVVAPMYAAAAGLGDLVRMQLVTLQTWLPSSILMKADKMAMAHSLEVRVPFLDPVVYDVAARLPLRDRVNRRTTKVALRRAAARHLPADTAERPKLGFPVPFRGWLDGGVGELLRDAVAGLDDPILDRRAVGRVLADERRPDRHHRAWALLVYLLWRDQFAQGSDVVADPVRTA